MIHLFLLLRSVLFSDTVRRALRLEIVGNFYCMANSRFLKLCGNYLFYTLTVFMNLSFHCLIKGEMNFYIGFSK